MKTSQPEVFLHTANFDNSLPTIESDRSVRCALLLRVELSPQESNYSPLTLGNFMQLHELDLIEIKTKARFMFAKYKIAQLDKMILDDEHEYTRK
ncbi:hypothetical protein T4B_3571 [Trichinella pseudospiralis]|uniref:Uncharacterized protein n=1 Tax=Trichinella pseudospiralis TaxID=6337 RepID=A0A0V1KF82_TRIPS|nr:hypothetical protein T4A_9245 [Trichinella pseudospiralis]KRZ32975.1 hypothetical protein T4B_3571 [Trichinella pseudospiralis]KRZ45930.1 hypothetical protein T4C_118 [Trichinella pseudospiralis]